MSTAAPLYDLAQRIQQQEAELAKLRDELQFRQAKIADLTSLKESLQAQLQQIDAEIESVGMVAAPKATPSPAPALAVKPVPATAIKLATDVSLPHFLVSLVEQAKGPITAKQLAEEVVRLKFPTTSKDVRNMVQTRVGDLVKKGILKRAGDQGVILGKSSPTAKPATAKVPAVMQTKPQTKAAIAKPAASVKPVEPATRHTLNAALTEVLAKSSHPLSAQELADQLLANGYETKSKDLKNVIWVSVGKMGNIERVAGKGYRLKKGKGTTTSKKA